MIRFPQMLGALPAVTLLLSAACSSDVLAEDGSYGSNGDFKDDGISYAVTYTGVDSIVDSTFGYTGGIVALEPRPGATSNIRAGRIHLSLGYLA
jgi:hypothetical protein